MNNKFTSNVILVAVALLCGASLLAQAEKKEPGMQQKKQSGPRPRLSPHETINARIPLDQGNSLISITYGRPFSAKGGKGEPRKIWGGLVPWGKADRLGADEATLLLTQAPLVIGETTIPAGAYTLYTVPTEAGVKLAFSSNLGKWGIPVDEKHDVARVDLVKSTLEHRVDKLTITLENDAATGGGVLRIWWENTQLSLPFAVKKA